MLECQDKVNDSIRWEGVDKREFVGVSKRKMKAVISSWNPCISETRWLTHAKWDTCCEEAVTTASGEMRLQGFGAVGFKPLPAPLMGQLQLSAKNGW